MKALKKFWDMFSYVGFCFFSFYIAFITIHYSYTLVIDLGYEVDRFGLLVFMLFGLGWLYRMFKYDIEKEEINNLRRKNE